MKRAIFKASVFLMGIFAYLILSITMYQNAMAEKIGGGNALDTVGGLYELWQDPDTKSYSVFAVASAINAAVSTRAMEECRIGERAVDWDCYTDLRSGYLKLITTYVKATDRQPTFENVTAVYWYWAEMSEFDESFDMGISAALFLQNVLNYYSDVAAEKKEDTKS